MTTGGLLQSIFSFQFSLWQCNQPVTFVLMEFAIGSAFCPSVGMGFIHLWERVWCRLVVLVLAYLGIVQRSARLAITTMGQLFLWELLIIVWNAGIDVQRLCSEGQNIVRSSCVGCRSLLGVVLAGVGLNWEMGNEEKPCYDFRFWWKWLT